MQIIHSTIKTPPASEVMSVQNNGAKNLTVNHGSNGHTQPKPKNSETAHPAVVVD